MATKLHNETLIRPAAIIHTPESQSAKESMAVTRLHVAAYLTGIIHLANIVDITVVIY